jgi:DNA-binding transcriptional LysR family regulator
VDIKRLEVFCQVVDLRSLSRAAEKVLLAQPTVSEHIRILEETVGEKLLDRLGREVLPTPAGQILYRYARQIIALRDEALQAIDDFRGRLSGSLVLGASTIPGAYILPERIESFRARFSEARVTLKIAGTARIVEELLAGQLELGIVGARTREPSLEASEIFSDELLLAVPPGHPFAGRTDVAAAELPGEPFILREPGSGTRQVVMQFLREQGIDPARLTVVAEMGSNEAVRQCIKARLGISILSSLALREDLEHGTLAALPLEGVRMTRPFYLVRRKGRRLSPLAQAFLEHLRTDLPSAPAE